MPPVSVPAAAQLGRADLQRRSLPAHAARRTLRAGRGAGAARRRHRGVRRLTEIADGASAASDGRSGPHAGLQYGGVTRDRQLATRPCERAWCHDLGPWGPVPERTPLRAALLVLERGVWL